MNNMSNLFVDANEKEISTLGSNYLRNFLSTGSLENGFCSAAGVADMLDNLHSGEED